jgi:acyl-homoserine lactone acylase PvdQ
MKARTPLVAAIALAVSLLFLASSGAAPPRDYAASAWTVLPPGSNGSLTFDRNTRDQAALYDGLTPLRGDVTEKSIKRWFKRAPLGLAGETPKKVERPRKGVVVARDRYGVPHVTGTTEANVAFGAGWVTAADRGLLLGLIRGPARLAAIDAPGFDPISLALSGKTFVPSAETEAFLANQLDALRATPKLGGRLVATVDAYVAGINAWHARNGIAIQPYTANDVVAAAALIAARFGANGGGEAENAQFLDALREKLGTQADAVFADLRQANDPEAPVSVPGSFSQALPASPAPGSVVLDDGSFSGVTVPKQSGASNALLVGAKRSATKRPLFVAGPQVGYLFPELFAEVDLQGAGFSVRGALFPGVPYIVIGRGPDFAWSATSSQADNIDLFVETLCDDSDLKYTLFGQCLPMRRFDAGVVKATGKPDQPVAFYETAHGPLLGYATVGGKRVGISLQRSTRGRELISARAFYELNTQRVTSARAFLTTMSRVEFAFNWFYADDRDIAMFSSGRLPVRAGGTDPALPTVGTGEYDWRGYLTGSQHAQAINPPSGAILNWNNKPAANVGAADSNFSYGSVQRVELLKTKIAAARTHTLASVVSAMNDAATRDLRAVEVWPVIRDVLGSSAAPSGRAEAAAVLVDRWRAAGSSRIDRNLDGDIDAPGAAVLDAAWVAITEAVLAPVLGDLTTRFEKLVARDDAPGPGGSAYLSGWYGYVEKDLRSLLGRPVRGPFSTAYCGDGSLLACSEALWVAIDGAAAALEKVQGSDPEGWRSDAAKERIDFTTGILPDTMRWTNRPTFQQVMSFSGHRPRT